MHFIRHNETIEPGGGEAYEPCPSDGRCEEVCQGYVIDTKMTSSGEPAFTEVLFENNDVEYCKFGLDVRGSAIVHAQNNRFAFNYVSGMRIGGGKVKAEDNTFVGNGYYANSDPPADVIVSSRAEAQVDLGFGDATGGCVPLRLPLLPPVPYCRPGEGNNAFCDSRAISEVIPATTSVGARGNCWSATPPTSLPTAPASSCTAIVPARCP
jgi:hypothetical protein